MSASRNAIVTNVLQLAGTAAARALARDGMNVLCHDLTFGDTGARKAFEERTGLATTGEQEPEKLINEALGRFGHIDVLFSNDVHPAGFLPIEQITIESFRATLEALLVMPFALIRAVVPHMKSRRTGHIILLSSATPLAPYPNSSGYCAARAGASNLPKSLSLELAEHNVQINAILSQFLHSEIYYPRALFEENAEVKAYLHAHVPARRLGEQEEQAELVAFLASDKCNFINGQTIPFTGAWPGMPPWPVKL